jgi:protein-S-isoprenylcysteine O-methyltransferase Ste14
MMWGWVGLMTLPLAMFLFLLMGRLDDLPWLIPRLLFDGSIIDDFLMVGGLLIVIVSVVYLHLKKGEGLVTGGPYTYVRHPQYTGIMLFTAAITSRSLFALVSTDGVGWLDELSTLFVWYALLLTYLCLASIEELHLSETFGEEWTEYQGRTGFMLPLIRSKSKAVELTLTVGVLGGMMLLLFMASASVLGSFFSLIMSGVNVEAALIAVISGAVMLCLILLYDLATYEE